MPFKEADGFAGRGQLGGDSEADHAGPDNRDIDVGHTVILFDRRSLIISDRGWLAAPSEQENRRTGANTLVCSVLAGDELDAHGYDDGLPLIENGSWLACSAFGT
jgi:hypothetical protein